MKINIVNRLSSHLPATNEGTQTYVKLSEANSPTVSNSNSCNTNGNTVRSCGLATNGWMQILAFIIFFAVFIQSARIAFDLYSDSVVGNRSSSSYVKRPEDKNANFLDLPNFVSNWYRDNSDDSLTYQNADAPARASAAQCSSVENNLKFDCDPERGASEATCVSRGCCWSVVSNYSVPLDVPYCFYPADYGGYNWVNVTATKTGLRGYMQRTFKSAYPDDVALLHVEVTFRSQSTVRVKITDAATTRFEPPFPEIPIIETAAVETDYKFLYEEKKTGFKIVRKADNQAIFDSLSIGGMIFADQFLQISSVLPSEFIYGLGFHTSTFLLSTHWSKFTMWNHDSIPKQNTNLYGSHPMYVCMEKSGTSHGVFLLNSNAMEVLLQPAPAVTFRTIGGVLDLFLFLGPSPHDVARQYSEVIGRPYMPPYWALGFHLCRFGYKTLDNTRAVMQRTQDFGIPLDVQWNDLDYMNNSNDFTYDRVNFRGLPQFVEELHSREMKYVVLVDAGVSSGEVRGAYPPYDEGMKMGVFVKNATTGLPFEGKVWNNVSTVWPDFTHPAAPEYWMKQLKTLHDQVEFDGAWIDMNEPSNFYSGTRHGCPANRWEQPPYVPAVDGGALCYKTLCMSAQQFAGRHYDVHNLYGFTEAIVTSFAMAEIRGSRPLVISRSTFPGHGHYAGHWSGDVVSSWEDMRASVPQLMNAALFGVPLSGADICGFNGNATAALCNRWSQLGAFYPFSRNHNTDDGIEQDPVAMGNDVATSAKLALLTRYSLLPYLYTLFHEAHTTGALVVRSLAFEFPNDVDCRGVDSQFLWGSGLMVVPVLEQDKLDVSAYLPAARWYDFYTGAALPSTPRVTLPAPLHHIPLLLRGGVILPTQAPNTTTAATRRSPFTLLVALDASGDAQGRLYWDDGETGGDESNELEFIAHGQSVRSRATRWGWETPAWLEAVKVFGVDQVKKVTVDGDKVLFSYDDKNKVLLVKDLKLFLRKDILVEWD